MNIQRLRNLTTGRLHTKIEDVYADLEFLTRESGIMTHSIPNACRAIEPWLRDKITEPQFFDGAHNPSHQGEIEIQPMTNDEREAFFERFGALPSPLAGFL